MTKILVSVGNTGNTGRLGNTSITGSIDNTGITGSICSTSNIGNSITGSTSSIGSTVSTSSKVALVVYVTLVYLKMGCLDNLVLVLNRRRCLDTPV